MFKILVAGELNPDFILQGYQTFPVPGKEVLVDDFTTTLGSASAICAMGMAKLGNSVALLSKIGNDLWGDFCVDILRSGGLDVSLIIRDPNVKTGVTVSISSPSDRALVTFLGAIVSLRQNDIEDQTLREFRHLHVSSYFLQQGLRPGCRQLFARAHKLGLTTSLDPGYDPSETWGADLHETLQETDIFFPNEVEALGLTGCEDPEKALQALQNGRTRVVLKLGSKGCMVLDANEVIRQPAFPIAPKDTTGAGDSFDAGFLHAFLRSMSLRECLRTGTACGALSTQGMGGISGQPDLAELELFLSSH